MSNLLRFCLVKVLRLYDRTTVLAAGRDVGDSVAAAADVVGWIVVAEDNIS